MRCVPCVPVCSLYRFVLLEESTLHRGTRIVICQKSNRFPLAPQSCLYGLQTVVILLSLLGARLNSLNKGRIQETGGVFVSSCFSRSGIVRQEDTVLFTQTKRKSARCIITAVIFVREGWWGKGEGIRFEIEWFSRKIHTIVTKLHATE